MITVSIEDSEESRKGSSISLRENKFPRLHSTEEQSLQGHAPYFQYRINSLSPNVFAAASAAARRRQSESSVPDNFIQRSSKREKYAITNSSSEVLDLSSIGVPELSNRWSTTSTILRRKPQAYSPRSCKSSESSSNSTLPTLDKVNDGIALRSGGDSNDKFASLNLHSVKNEIHDEVPLNDEDSAKRAASKAAMMDYLAMHSEKQRLRRLLASHQISPQTYKAQVNKSALGFQVNYCIAMDIARRDIVRKGHQAIVSAIVGTE